MPETMRAAVFKDVSNTVKMTQGINLKVTQIQPITFF